MSSLQFCLDCRRRFLKSKLLFFLISFAFSALMLEGEAPWSAVGPEGGDARAFAAVPGQPSHLYLGTTTSWVYESTDGGASWRRLAELDDSGGLIIDNIVVDSADSSLIYVAAFRADHPDGGLWVSHDGGRSWDESKGLHGQSILAFAQAPSDAK